MSTLYRLLPLAALAALTACDESKPLSLHTVTFDSRGGSALRPVTVARGKAIARQRSPTRAGYIFSGWYSDAELSTAFNLSTPIESNQVLYAKWVEWNGLGAASDAAGPHTVRFELNGGIASSAGNADPQAIADGGLVAVPDPSPVWSGYAYIFSGWYADAALVQPFDFALSIRGDRVLYAKWRDRQGRSIYGVRFELNGGIAGFSGNTDLQAVAEGALAASPSPDPVRQGYFFSGWHASGSSSAFDFTKPIKSNLTLQAQWVVNLNHRVTFATHSILSSIGDVYVPPGKAVSKPVDPRKQEGIFDVEFEGWYADAALVQPFDFAGAIVSDTTLYARYGATLLVSTVKQLRGIADADLNRSYRLTADIDLGGAPFTPIGTPAIDASGEFDATRGVPFAGQLDGDGHRVRGLHIDLQQQHGVGLIAYNAGTVKDIAIEVSDQGVMGGKHTGALAGQNAGAISGVSVQGGKVKGGFNVGALVGWNAASGSVAGYAANVAVGGVAWVGGLVGESFGFVTGYVAHIEITAKGYLGGLVGTNNGSVIGYAADAKVSVGSGPVGGLVGDNVGSVTGYGVRCKILGKMDTGGLVGENKREGVVRGHFRGVVVRLDNGTVIQTSFGFLAGNVDYTTTGSVSGYNSGRAGESAFQDLSRNGKRTGVDGVAIVVNANTQQGAFSGFDFGPALGQWTFRSGRWPAINLPAEVGGKYRPEDQPTHP